MPTQKANISRIQSRKSILSRLALPLVALASFAAGDYVLQPAAAQNQAAEKEKTTEQTVEDVATKPAEYLGVSKKEIPPELKEYLKKPYSLKNIKNCADIEREVSKLDKVLGADLDVKKDKSKDQKRKETAEKVGGSVVTGFIPFRGLVREVSGAASRQRAYNAAVYSGVVRRAFLKGVGQQKGCPYPAQPKSVK